MNKGRRRRSKVRDWLFRTGLRDRRFPESVVTYGLKSWPSLETLYRQALLGLGGVLWCQRPLLWHIAGPALSN